MEEKQPLVQRACQNNGHTPEQSCCNTRTKVLFFVMINSIGLLVSGTAQTQYIYDYVKRNDFPNTSTDSNKSLLHSQADSCPGIESKNEKQIQARSSDWSWYINVIEYGLGIPIIILVGPIADKVGKKPIMIYNLSLMTISFAVKTVSIYCELGLYIFMTGSAIEGLSGTSATFNLANLAILADQTTTGKDRTIMMALYDAILGAGAFLSHVGSGYLIELGTYWYPFAISTGLLLLLVFLVGFSLQDHSRKTITEDSGFTKVSTLFFSIYSPKNIKCSRLYIIMHLMLFLLSVLPMTSLTNILTLYTLGFPFCWTAEHIGWYGAISSVVVMIIGTAILKLVHICHRGSSDNALIIAGYLSTIGSFMVYGFSKTDHMIYAGVAVSVLRILPVPLIKAIVSRVVIPSKQGALFSNIYLVEAVCLMFGSTIFNNIYHQTVSIYSGLTFFVMAGFPFICIGKFVLMTQLMDSPNIEQELKVERSNKDYANNVENADIQEEKLQTC